MVKGKGKDQDKKDDKGQGKMPSRARRKPTTKPASAGGSLPDYETKEPDPAKRPSHEPITEPAQEPAPEPVPESVQEPVQEKHDGFTLDGKWHHYHRCKCDYCGEYILGVEKAKDHIEKVHREVIRMQMKEVQSAILNASGNNMTKQVLTPAGQESESATEEKENG